MTEGKNDRVKIAERGCVRAAEHVLGHLSRCLVVKLQSWSLGLPETSPPSQVQKTYLSKVGTESEGLGA